MTEKERHAPAGRHKVIQSMPDYRRRHAGLTGCIVFCAALWLGNPMGWAADQTAIFPAPVKVELHEGSLCIAGGTPIVKAGKSEKLAWVAEFLANELGAALGTPEGKLRLIDGGAWETRPKPAIFLRICDTQSFAELNRGSKRQISSEGQGAYVLVVTKDGANVCGRDAQGIYYGSLTLLQLFSNTGEGKGRLACATVVDHPFHLYRGMRTAPPRGKPRPGEISHEYFRNFMRLLSYFRLNHVWVQGTSWGIPLRRHPETAWKDVLTVEQARGFDGFAARHFLSLDGSLDWSWLNYGYKHLAELYPDETWEKMRPQVKNRSRLNPCPSNPETWKMLFESMDDVMEVLSGDHFAISLDEMYQENHGSRWAVCPLCRGKDPVRLWADFANRLAAQVIENGRIPIMSGGMLLREHQGWYKNIYQAIDMIDNRNKIVIYNWSEGHIRRGAMKVEGRRLRIADMKTTPFFRRHGYKDVMHLLMNRWEGRPELREVNGKLDCYGGFVSYYHPMDYDTMKQQGTLAGLVFSAQHLWSPDIPPMDSEEDRRLCRYGEALADAVLMGRTFVDAVTDARRVYN